MNDIDLSDGFRRCGFCEEFLDADTPLGTASHYCYLLDDDGDDDDSYIRAPVCADCALSTSNADPDHRHLAACELCGRVAPTTNGNVAKATDPDHDGPRYANQGIRTWMVSIRGFDGSLTTCRKCAPVVDPELAADYHERVRGKDLAREDRATVEDLRAGRF